jgi:hypothetical protein
MIECLAELVNRDENLVRRGRHVNTTFLVEVGDARYLVCIAEGRVAGIKPGPFVTPSYSFALRGSRGAWEKYWQPIPPPGFNHLFALAKRQGLRIEGDLHPLMANLLYFDDVLAAPRAALGAEARP